MIQAARKIRGLDFLPAVVAALAAFLCYVDALPNGFVSDDDHLIFQHPFVKRVADWPRIFTAGHYEGNGGYRPLTTLTFAVNYLAGDHRPFGYHLVNLALHALNCALLALVLTRLFGAPVAAGAAAVIFAVHPVHTEAVAWISGRAELLAAAFFLMAWLFHLRGLKEKGRALSWPKAAALLSFFAAALSKENALVFPLAMILSDRLLPGRTQARPRPIWTGWREWVGRYGWYFAVIGFYFVFRSSLYRTSLLRLPAQIQFIDNPLVSLSWVARSLTALKIQGQYLWLLVWPGNLCADYSFNTIPLVERCDAGTALALVTLVLLVALGFRSYLRGGRLWFGIAFYFLAIFPVSNLATVIGTIKAERLLYLPSIGLAAVFVAVFEQFPFRLVARLMPALASRAVAGAAWLFLCTIGSWRTWEQNKIWQNEETLWRSVVKVAPNNFKAQLTLGELDMGAKRLPEAIKAFQFAHAINPGSDDAVMNLGAALMANGSAEPAVELYEEATRREPARASFHLNLGLACLATGRSDRGLAELERSVALAPTNPVAWLDLGLALSKTGSPADALDAYRRSTALEPNFAEGWNAMGAVLLKLGRREEARAALARALQIRPGYGDALYNLTLIEH